MTNSNLWPSYFVWTSDVLVSFSLFASVPEVHKSYWVCMTVSTWNITLIGTQFRDFTLVQVPSKTLQCSRDNTYSVEIDQVVQMGILVNLKPAIAFTGRSEESLFDLAAFLAHSVYLALKQFLRSLSNGSLTNRLSKYFGLIPHAHLGHKVQTFHKSSWTTNIWER